MEIEKLIEQLQKSADFEDYPVVASFAAIIEKKYLREAATALEQLQAENDSLKGERDAVLESFPHECNSCRYQTIFFNGYAPVYSCTNPDGYCSNNYDRWQWRGPKEGKKND